MGGCIRRSPRGSVDRNALIHTTTGTIFMSLPSRGAWIEMASFVGLIVKDRVAPLAGSVDRNSYFTGILSLPPGRSPRGERG